MSHETKSKVSAGCFISGRFEREPKLHLIHLLEVTYAFILGERFLSLNSGTVIVGPSPTSSCSDSSVSCSTSETPTDLVIALEACSPITIMFFTVLKG